MEGVLSPIPGKELLEASEDGRSPVSYPGKELLEASEDGRSPVSYTRSY
jgi:hypothetical protein